MHRVNNKVAVKNTRIKLFLTVDSQQLDARKQKRLDQIIMSTDKLNSLI